MTDSVMPVQALAQTHALCFDTPRPWSAHEFSQLLTGRGVFLTGTPTAFALGRAVAGECELLTLAVHPDQRRGGLGMATLSAYEGTAAQHGATVSFLEVSAENHVAIALYRRAGYHQTGRRPRYYKSPAGTQIDALILSKTLDAF